MALQFDNIVDYIWQIYSVGIPVEYAEKNAKPLTYYKLVRVLQKLNIDPTDLNSVQLFSEAVRLEKGSHFDPRANLMFQLADLHEECEILIRGSGVLDKGDAYVDSINS
uniref:Uncharacterized protein n=1 Tax=Pseudomonas phage RVTF4 TaxID=3236931 RepID=A0AB39CCI2_9VIRU